MLLPVHACKARKDLKKQCTKFSRPREKEIEDRAEAFLVKGAVTVAEYYVMNGLLQYDRDWEAGVAIINEQVRGFTHVIIKANMLQKALWRCANAMICGKKFVDT